MRKVIPFIVLMCLFATNVYSDSKQLFTDVFAKKFENNWPAPVSKCLASGLYDLLSDKEKGLMQSALELLESDSSLDDEKAGLIMLNLYDQDESIKNNIERKWHKESVSIVKQCEETT